MRGLTSDTTRAVLCILRPRPWLRRWDWCAMLLLLQWRRLWVWPNMTHCRGAEFGCELRRVGRGLHPGRAGTHQVCVSHQVCMVFSCRSHKF